MTARRGCRVSGGPGKTGGSRGREHHKDHKDEGPDVCGGPWGRKTPGWPVVHTCPGPSTLTGASLRGRRPLGNDPSLPSTRSFVGRAGVDTRGGSQGFPAPPIPRTTLEQEPLPWGSSSLPQRNTRQSLRPQGERLWDGIGVSGT